MTTPESSVTADAEQSKSLDKAIIPENEPFVNPHLFRQVLPHEVLLCMHQLHIVIPADQ